MNKKFFSWTFIASALFLSACQNEKTEHISSQYEGKNQSEHIENIQQNTQKTVMEKLEDSREDISKMAEKAEEKLNNFSYSEKDILRHENREAEDEEQKQERDWELEQDWEK